MWSKARILERKVLDEIDQLSSELGKVNVYVGSDGKLHYVNKDGADSALPFSIFGHAEDIRCKYGTGNNSYVSATPVSISGYTCVLFGFLHLMLAGAAHVADVYADNSALRAGSQYGTQLNAAYCAFYVRKGTSYIIKEHVFSAYSSNDFSDDVPGYKLVGAVIHFSGYSCSNTSGNAMYVSTEMDRSNDHVKVAANFNLVSSVTCKAMLLYMPA